METATSWVSETGKAEVFVPGVYEFLVLEAEAIADTVLRLAISVMVCVAAIE
jgi:hypothetical protein